MVTTMQPRTWKVRFHARLLMFFGLLAGIIAGAYSQAPLYNVPEPRSFAQNLPWTAPNLMLADSIMLGGTARATISVEQFKEEVAKRPGALLLFEKFSYQQCDVESRFGSTVRYVLIDAAVAFQTHIPISFNQKLSDDETIQKCSYQNGVVRLESRATHESAVLNFLLWAGVVLGGVIISWMATWISLGEPGIMRHKV